MMKHNSKHYTDRILEQNILNILSNSKPYHKWYKIISDKLIKLLIDAHCLGDIFLWQKYKSFVI